MDYEFFQSLTADQARTYLSRLLEVERKALHEMESCAARDGIVFDYSISTLADALEWMVKRVRVYHVPMPDDVPEWIRHAHPDGLTEFDDDSKSIVLRAGYYLGECFARLPGLHWTTGDIDYIERNMPVVAGFNGGQELPPLVVVENVFKRIVDRKSPVERIYSTIENWLRDCPMSSS